METIKLTRQQKRHPERFAHGQAMENQAKLNSFLWRLVMNQGGVVEVPYSDIKNIPCGAGIEVDNVPGTDKVKIKAVVNGPIVAPERRIIV